jgi:hypothetical protein
MLQGQTEANIRRFQIMPIEACADILISASNIHRVHDGDMVISEVSMPDGASFLTIQGGGTAVVVCFDPAAYNACTQMPYGDA